MQAQEFLLLLLLLLLLPAAAAAAAHAEGKAAVRSWFMEHILQPPYHTIVEHILQPTPSPLTSSSPLPPLTASSIRFTRFPPPPLRFASRPYSARAHVLVGCKPTPPLFMELPFFPVSTIHHRSNLSNKSFTSHISTAGEDQQPGKMLRLRNFLNIHQILRHKVEKPLVQFKAL